LFRKTNSPKKVTVANSDRWKTVAESAIYLRCSPQHVRTLIHNSKLKAVRCGKGFLLDRNDLDGLLVRRKRFFNPYRRGTKPWVAQRHAENRRAA
jgi:excisionase family DNA binding protein